MASQDLRIVRILLVGDSQSGKTSIILALVGEEFPLFVPPRAEEITIPADVTPEKVPTHIVDYSAQEQDEDTLVEEIGKAHVVCIVYDVTKADALDRVTSHWLPFIKRCSGESVKPVVLVGNKVDLPYDAETQSQTLQEILNIYMEVETGIECSAKELHNVSELFYFAQKAVLHPTTPLYSPNERELKPECAAALERVFRLCDTDNDGLLNDQELNEFQVLCFDAPLQPQALLDVKAIVKRNVAAGIMNDALTMEGFLFLNKLFIQRGRHETTWKVLRKFGYSNALTLRDEFVTPVFSPQPSSTVELSRSGYQFLQNLFFKYDKDKDGALSPQEQEDMFALCPDYPWDEQLLGLTVETNQKGWITLNGFLAFWTLQTVIDYGFTSQFLAWTGYSVLDKESLASALLEIRPLERHKSVFRCCVFGSKNAGKTLFIRGLIGRDQTTTATDTEQAITIRLLETANYKGYLVLQEVTSLPGDEEGVREIVEQCDVVCLLYDAADPSSFSPIAGVFSLMESSGEDIVPCVFVATKSDLVRVKQEYAQQPEEYCHKYHLPLPYQISYSAPEAMNTVYTKLMEVAMNPDKNIPSSFHIPSWAKVAGIGLLMGAGLGAVVYYVVKAGRFQTSHSPYSSRYY